MKLKEILDDLHSQAESLANRIYSLRMRYPECRRKELTEANVQAIRTANELATIIGQLERSSLVEDECYDG